MRLCSLPSCGRRHLARGMCDMHYGRWREYGNLNDGRDQPEPRRGPAGSGYINPQGYRMIEKGGRIKGQHILIAEAVLGKPLPPGAHVHHADCNPSNNANRNLVICPSAKYHKWLHQRTEALEACGHADWLQCQYCRKWDDPTNLQIQTNCHNGRRLTQWHRQCRYGYELHLKIVRRLGVKREAPLNDATRAVMAHPNP